MREIPVTVLITAKDRPEELRFTLGTLREQTHRPLEIMVIDDGSAQSLESVLGDDFPEVAFIRHQRSRGLIASRSAGFTIAGGDYLVSLDDDSHFCDAGAIDLAVRRMERETDIGVLAFQIVESKAHCRPDRSSQSCYSHLFVGCGHMLRREAVRRVGGYMDCFEYGAEEEEYSLRLLDDGWKVLYFPEVVVDHRVSAIGRRRGKILAYTFRNSVWTLFLRTPIPYAVAHAFWKSMLHFSNTIREAEFGWFWWGLWDCIRGLPRMLRQRQPVRLQTFLLSRTLRRRGIRTAEDFEAARESAAGGRLALLVRS